MSRRTLLRFSRLAVAALATTGALAGCAGAGRPAPTQPTTAGVGAGALEPNGNESTVQAGPLVTSGTFAPFPGGTPGPGIAVRYDDVLVPAGATARLSVAGLGGRTVVNLTATGLVPGHTYGAHLHTKPCGAAPADAGPHYQHVPDPSPPSVDPTYANPQNEVWLDFRAGADGAGTARAVQQWMFTADAPARSLVLHARSTLTGNGHAGMAGGRVGCLNLDY